MFDCIPDITEPDLAKAIQAADLACAGEAMPQDLAEALIDWSVFNNRYNLANKNSRESYEENYSIRHDSLWMECGFGQAVTAYTLEKSGVDIRFLNAQDFKSQDAEHGLWKHAFCVADIHVIHEDGEQGSKKFLIDTTYRQFFDCPEIDLTDAPLKFLQKEEEINFANTLLKKGWVELTEENAHIYAISFNKGKSVSSEESMVSFFDDMPDQVPIANSSTLSKKGYYMDHPKNLTEEVCAGYADLVVQCESECLAEGLFISNAGAVLE